MAAAPLILKPRFSLLRNPNPRLLPCSSSSSSVDLAWSPLRGGCSRRLWMRCSAEGGGGGVAQRGLDFEHERVVHPKPATIPWRKDIANTVHLIGVVGTPVQIKYVSSGKVLAWTRLGVKNSPTETTWYAWRPRPPPSLAFDVLEDWRGMADWLFLWLRHFVDV